MTTMNTTAVKKALIRLVEMPWFYSTIRWLFWGFASWYYGFHVEGTARVPREGGLVVAVNHISTLDPPMMGAAMPREISFMAKKELFDFFPQALLFRGLHAFPVDRTRSDVGAIKEAMRRLKAERVVGIFVQGTRNTGDADALDGAAFLAQRAGVPLLPAAIFRDGRRFRVRFGEPFGIEGKGRAPIREATAKVMHRIEALLPSHTHIHPPGEELDEDGIAPRAPAPSDEESRETTR